MPSFFYAFAPVSARTERAKHKIQHPAPTRTERAWVNPAIRSGDPIRRSDPAIRSYVRAR